MKADPRTYYFKFLTLTDGSLLVGRWKVFHIGYGEHYWQDDHTKDTVPFNAVLLATNHTKED